ncbi:hypothetical protein K466DRAFT_555648 [Polyporus arcularius HHB13444]|uniref:S5 DRBM domain-containing protein n=1 Tax=Polyporus arcularius HHB13444 TaxID=1314778 RepID=A0A5C3P457_9APHY|nr:hypothetical protein K466DRAFT_555648 [Polyporus arcularius HHB13444]
MSSKLARTLLAASSRRPCCSVPSNASRHYSTPTKPPNDDLRRIAEQQEFAEALAQSQHFPNLMTPDALLDIHESKTFPPNRHTPFANTVVVRNNPSIFRIAREIERGEKDHALVVDEVESSTDAMKPIKFLHLPPFELQKLHRAQLLRFVKQQTGKGKIERIAILMVVGNGRGLVGLGEGKGTDYQTALGKAFPQAVRNMDYIERFEDRTIWTEMESKFGATRIILRPRPVGFGLATNPIIHEVFKVAGIKDASAKVWGSRNPYQVMKAVVARGGQWRRAGRCGQPWRSRGTVAGGSSRFTLEGLPVEWSTHTCIFD